jgi:hypothetical protein
VIREAVNERVKSYLRMPTLYLTTVVMKDEQSYEACAWSESFDPQTARGISLHSILAKHRRRLDEVADVNTVEMK